MANHSRLVLYVASIQIGEVRTLVQSKLVVKGTQLRNTLEENASPLLRLTELEPEVEKYAGSVRLPASLEAATSQLIYFVAPLVAHLEVHNRKCEIEVMFNDPTINRVVREGRLDQWRKNNFAYKNIGASKQPIHHASKWAAFDELLKRLGGKVCYNHDDVLRTMVGNLKKLSRRKPNVSIDAGDSG